MFILVLVTVSANITGEGRKIAGRPFTWRHICMVIDVIPYPVTLCLLSAPFTTSNNNDPPSRLQTHAVLQSAFMPVDFWRLWCHYEAGWRFDIVPLEFHAPCVLNWLKQSVAGTVEIGVLLPFAQEDYQSDPSQRWSSHCSKVSVSALKLWGMHFSFHLISKHVSNPANLWMQNDPVLYRIYSCRGLFK